MGLEAKSTRRVLIVTSSYAPTMIADMHRARQLAWELPKLGWHVEILHADENFQPESCIDSDSAPFFAPGTPIHSVPELFPALFRAVGARTIGVRALVPILLAGRKLLKRRRFDLVYFSTASFLLFLLGPAWRRFRVPFVLDLHDPFFKEKRWHPVWARPGLKHALGRLFAKFTEARSIRTAAGLVSVSPKYVDVLRYRYLHEDPPCLRGNRHAVIPFAALPQDLEEVRKTTGPCSPRLGRSGLRRIVYVGAGGPIMVRSFSLLCEALASLRLRRRELIEQIRLELYGTVLGWREGDPRVLAGVSQQWGLAEVVTEEPRRVSYRRSLELLLESDGALLLGVDDEGFTPSKLANYGLSAKPLLASLHRESPAFAHFQNNPHWGRSLWFDQFGKMNAEEASYVVEDFLLEAVEGKLVDRHSTLQPWLAASMAQRHAELFSTCIQDEPHWSS